MDPIATEPTTASIERVAVIGAGLLGSQIAALVAASGRRVSLYDVVPGVAAKSGDRLREMLAPVIARDDLDWNLDAVLDRIRPVETLRDAAEDADLIIEAVREHLPTKRAVFAELSQLNPTALLATNSSSLPSSTLADVVIDPGKLANMHFFSEFWQRSMVEVMGSGQTTEETMATLATFCRSLGLVTAVVHGESKGFIINRVWRAVKREVLRVVDEGHAAPEDVDRLWALFFGTEIGPFGIMDGIGLDVIADIEESYIAVATDPTDQGSPTLRDLVADGRLGRKTGEGFYRYPYPAYEASGWPRVNASEGT